jgi:hypothetical protein
MPPPLNEKDSIQASNRHYHTATQHRHDQCLLQALMSRRTTRQPHPRMLPFAYAPRLHPNPRFVVALVQHSGKHLSAHVYVSRTPINGAITDAITDAVAV